MNEVIWYAIAVHLINQAFEDDDYNSRQIIVLILICGVRACAKWAREGFSALRLARLFGVSALFPENKITVYTDVISIGMHLWMDIKTL